MSYGSQQSSMLSRVPMGSQVADMVSGLANTDVGRTGEQISTGLRTSITSAVRERPIATLAAVAVISFALGAMWRS